MRILYTETMATTLRRWSLALGIVLSLLLPWGVFAASFTATPLVIDGKGKPREIMHFSVTLENTGTGLASIYPWVTNYTSASGTEEMPDLAHADLTTSLANWIEVTRGVIDLMPGERREVPVMIQINQTAKPGMYHAEIKFSPGNSRIEAEAAIAQTLIIPVNIEVMDDANEKLQLGTFVPAKNWFTTEDATFDVKLQNIGNRGLVPTGKIRIYDRRGAEIASVDANQNGDRLEPSNERMLAAVWHAGDNFGRYKAMLDLEYGEGGRGTLQDTVFFWIVPWQKVLGLFLTIMVISVIIAVMLHMRAQANRSPYAYAHAYHEAEVLEDDLRRRANDAGYVATTDPEEDDRAEGTFATMIARARHAPEPLEIVERTDLRAERYDTRAFDSTELLPRERPPMIRPGAIRLEARPKQGIPPSPEHIVNLKG